jgi:hypothetical protein
VKDRCNGCGRVDALTEEFQCVWPDGRTTVERHCVACERTWHRQLKALGARVMRLSGAPRPDIMPAEDES